MLRLISLWSYKTRHKKLSFRDSKITLNIALNCLVLSGLGIIKSFLTIIGLMVAITI